MNALASSILQWASTSFALWVCGHVFRGIKFESTQSLVISALLLGFANAIVKPVLLVLTFPLTLLTLGLFLLVINALVLLLVAWLVKGFTISGFWTAFFASMLISLLSWVVSGFFNLDGGAPLPAMPQSSGGVWM